MSPIEAEPDDREESRAPEPAPPPGGDAAGEPTGAGAASPDAPHPPDEVDVAARGGVWSARVLGRSARTRAGSPPLLLLEFRPAGGGAAALQGWVVGRSLADVPQEALESALARATEPPPVGRRRPFFEDADRGRAE